MVGERGFTRLATILNIPCVPLFVVNELGSVITLVEVLEDSREHLWTFVREVKAASAFEELCLECRLKV